MAKYSSPNDVYHALVDESDQNWLLALLSFAVVEEKRIEWTRHLADTSGSVPSASDVQSWYEAQPRSVLLRARAQAEAALKTYGEQAVQGFDEGYRREIAQGVVVGEIRTLGRWWRQLGMNIIGGFISSLLFTAMLILVAFVVLNEPSPNGMSGKLKHTLEKTNGQMQRNEQARHVGGLEGAARQHVE